MVSLLFIQSVLILLEIRVKSQINTLKKEKPLTTDSALILPVPFTERPNRPFFGTSLVDSKILIANDLWGFALVVV